MSLAPKGRKKLARGVSPWTGGKPNLAAPKGRQDSFALDVRTSGLVKPIESATRFHLVGIGGIGMSGLARLLLHRGLHVQGSDIQPSALLEHLRQEGATVFVGHDASSLNSAEVVVISTAIHPDNPEVQAAQRRGLPIIHRSELLAMLMQGKRGIAVTGTHGKSTTTAMLATVLIKAGLDPSVVLGAEMDELGGNARPGDGDFFVAEADESDGSFLRLHPEIAVITNVERDHTDYFADDAQVLRTFQQFVDTIEPGGVAIVSADCPRAARLRSRKGVQLGTFGSSETAQWRVQNYHSDAKGSSFDIVRQGESLIRVRLRTHGIHNALNGAAALAAAYHAGIQVEQAAQFLNEYHGIRRRMEVLGERNGAIVVDDYAHNPAKVRAAISAARERWDGKIIAIFQPHRFTRTRDLASDFGSSFGHADHVIVTDIYAASERPIEGVSGKLIVEAIREQDPDRTVEYIPAKGDVLVRAHSLAKPGHALLFIGAGDITHWARDFAQGND